jgi:hypothetical protein
VTPLQPARLAGSAHHAQQNDARVGSQVLEQRDVVTGTGRTSGINLGLRSLA